MQPQLKARILRPVVRTKIADTATITSTTIINTDGGSIGLSFSAAEVAAGSLLIGTVQPGARIDKVAIIVDAGFDNGTQFTVGDDNAHARLMAVSENAPNIAGRFAADVDHEYVTETEIKFYLAAGMPSKGSGQVVIYF